MTKTPLCPFCWFLAYGLPIPRRSVGNFMDFLVFLGNLIIVVYSSFYLFIVWGPISTLPPVLSTTLAFIFLFCAPPNPSPLSSDWSNSPSLASEIVSCCKVSPSKSFLDVPPPRWCAIPSSLSVAGSLFGCHRVDALCYLGPVLIGSSMTWSLFLNVFWFFSLGFKDRIFPSFDKDVILALETNLPRLHFFFFCRSWSWLCNPKVASFRLIGKSREKEVFLFPLSVLLSSELQRLAAFSSFFRFCCWNWIPSSFWQLSWLCWIRWTRRSC